MFIGIGTLVNAVTVLLGSALGVLIGHRLPLRTRSVVTDALGLVTLLIAASSAIAVTDASLSDAVGDSAPMLIVLGSLLIGAVLGSLGRIEDRLEGLGDVLQHRLTRGSPQAGADVDPHASRDRFITGFMTASLVFCVGPLTILGSVTEGIGEGPDQLYLKAALDGFASIAFAAAFGWGVAASVLTLVVIQGSLTALGAALGDVLPDAHLAALTATGGLLLVGVALRLLEIKQLKVGDLLPALLIAPLLTEVVVQLR